MKIRIDYHWNPELLAEHYSIRELAHWQEEIKKSIDEDIRRCGHSHDLSYWQFTCLQEAIKIRRNRLHQTLNPGSTKE